MKLFAHGKRGRIYLQSGVAKKVSAPKRIKNEVYWLKILNKHNIGPKLIDYKKTSFRYKFVKGTYIGKFLETSDKNKIRKILINVFKQCRKLDKLKVNKLEMTNPYKHIVISKKIVLIDFERAKLSEKPKNVTQFCQYITSRKVSKILKKKGFKINKEKINESAKIYKHKQSEKNFNKILRQIK